MVAEPRLGACDAAVVHAVHGLKAYARHADIVWVVGHSGRRGCKATASRGRRGGTCGLVFGGCGSAVLADTRGFLGGALAVGHGLCHRTNFGLPSASRVFAYYTRNSARERGTKPDALGHTPCHGTSTSKAAVVHASRAWKNAPPQCMTFLT
jgi:hypothetical protein